MKKTLYSAVLSDLYDILDIIDEDINSFREILMIFVVIVVFGLMAFIIAVNENSEQVKKFRENSKAEFIQDNSGTETIEMPIF